MPNVLDAAEQREVLEILGRHGSGRAAAVEALKAVQARRGWVGDQALAGLAGALGLSAAELDGLATAYPLIFRRPVGRHVILLCDSLSCWIRGQEELLAALRAQLGVGFGGTSADGRFTLLPAACLGACDRAPAMMVDGDLHGPVEPGRLDAVLAAYL